MNQNDKWNIFIGEIWGNIFYCHRVLIEPKTNAGHSLMAATIIGVKDWGWTYRPFPGISSNLFSIKPIISYKVKTIRGLLKIKFIVIICKMSEYIFEAVTTEVHNPKAFIRKRLQTSKSTMHRLQVCTEAGLSFLLFFKMFFF